MRCTRRFVPIVVKNVKFPSNLMEQDQYTAGNVMLRDDRKEEPTEDTE